MVIKDVGVNQSLLHPRMLNDNIMQMSFHARIRVRESNGSVRPSSALSQLPLLLLGLGLRL